MKKKIVGLLMLLLAAAFLAAGIKQGDKALLGGVALAALFTFLGLRRLITVKPKKGNQTPKAAPPAPIQHAAAPQPPKPSYSFVNFSVAGTSFKNDDGTERQVILQHLKFQDPPYATDDNYDVHIQPYEYKGKPAYKCLVNGYMVGNVPAVVIPQVEEALRHDDLTVTGFGITGGGTLNGEKLFYGCDIALRYSSALQE